jgi:NADH-quinone oxidoreductase subunit L
LPLPRLMSRVLWPLAVLSLVVGLLKFPRVLSGSEWLARFLATVPGALSSLPVSPGLEGAMQLSMGAFSLVGLGVAYYLYSPKKFRFVPAPGALASAIEDLFFNAFYLDHLYRRAVSDPYRRIAGFLWVRVDEGVVDQGIVRGAGVFPFLSLGLRLWTTGRLSTYLGMMFLGFAAILGAIVLGWYPW